MSNQSMTSLLRTEAFINGRWASASHQFDVCNPATGAVIAKVANSDSAMTHAAIDAAAQALPQWRALLPKQRAQLLRRWHQLVLDNKRALAELMTTEQGKPLAEAMTEVEYGASYIDWFAGEAERSYGTILSQGATGHKSWYIRQAIGVCAAITPWNFPHAMITRKLAPALAAGCTMVVKPAEATPLSALALAQLAHDAGIPAGVINILPTQQPAAIGEILTTHPDIKKFTFTGSTAVGKQLMAQCASTVKKVSLELGGNAPFIVFEDANLELAAAELIRCKFRNAGQTCISANRVLVQHSVLSQFLELLQSKLQQLTIGSGFEPAVDYGPLINQAAIDKVAGLIADAVAHGAELIAGGKLLPELGPLYYAPTLIFGITPAMRIAQEEIFGPVIAIQAFTDEAQAIRLANAAPVGLAGYFCTEDYRRIERVSTLLECGMLGINTGAISHAYNAFGGIKESGIGREGSPVGIAEYQEIKNITLGDLA